MSKVSKNRKVAVEAAAKEKMVSVGGKGNSRGNGLSKNRKANEPPLHTDAELAKAAAKEKQVVSGKVTGTGNKKGFSINRKSIDEPPLHTDVEPISI